MIRISIAMATYNGERFIAEQLESLAAQTVAPHELVVCDDGSTDGTLGIVEAFARRSPFPVRVIRNEKNLGYADNFLKAASLCEAEWVAFCDQDDRWAPEKLALVGQAVGRDPEVLLVQHPAYLTDERGEPTGEVAWPSEERTYRRLGHFPWRSGMGCGQVFRTWLVREIPHDDRFMIDPERPSTTSPHDDWVLKLSQCLGSAHYMARPLVYRRRHAQSVTAERGPPMRLPKGALRRTGLAGELERYSILARNRAEVLRRCAARCAPSHGSRLLDSAAYFETAAVILERRSLWRTHRGLSRVAGALKLMSAPGYWRMGWGVVGWRGFLRDLLDLKPAGATA